MECIDRLPARLLGRCQCRQPLADLLRLLDKKNKALSLSHIFKWYEGDFVKKGERIADYVARYLNPDDAEFVRNNEVAIKYLDYDWGLSEQK